MTTLALATERGMALLHQRDAAWQVEIALAGHNVTSLVYDPQHPQRLYAGTFGDSLWRSDDAGRSWKPAGAGIASPAVMAVAVSPLERNDGHAVVWAGTEPSAVFRSEDGGHTWIERPGLTDLPSAPTWSFPPRPWTHHVRWIAPDAVEPARLFVGIELGGVMRSLDGGHTWEDRKPGSEPDTHLVTTHPRAPGRVYEAAGGGYAESHDGGATWHGGSAGLRHRYTWSLAIHPDDPDTLVLSAAHGPRQAHNTELAESTLYRRVAGQPWQEISAGLPPSRGQRVRVLAASRIDPGVFYAANNHGVLCSRDAGQQWEALPVAWPEAFPPPGIHAIAVLDGLAAPGR